MQKGGALGACGRDDDGRCECVCGGGVGDLWGNDGTTYDQARVVCRPCIAVHSTEQGSGNKIPSLSDTSGNPPNWVNGRAGANDPWGYSNDVIYM